MKKVVITGSTGMIGKGVLIECLENEAIDQVLVINRSSVEIQHPKLKEIIHQDFQNFDTIKEELENCDACFFCLGVSSIGMDEEAYTKITYSITEALANTLQEVSPNLVFNYVSGQGTDSSEKGRLMWARVKGKTENMILDKGFKDAYAFRIGAVLPVKGVKSKTGWVNAVYFIFRPLLPILRKPFSIIKSSEVGQAMINTLFHSTVSKILDNKAIKALAER